jgi:hypothetical protein
MTLDQTDGIQKHEVRKRANYSFSFRDYLQLNEKNRRSLAEAKRRSTRSYSSENMSRFTPFSDDEFAWMIAQYEEEKEVMMK